MSGKFTVLKSSTGQYRFNLIAPNGQIILSSEQYFAKAGVLNGIQSVRANAPYDWNYDRRAASNGEPYFVLKAPNGEIIGRSETYSSKYAMENGISAVKQYGPTAIIHDQS
jgi:uncharacterized protein YegP (UPF0339 family)